MAGIFERVQWQILFPRFAVGLFPKPQFIYGRGWFLGLRRNIWQTLVFWRVALRLETIQYRYLRVFSYCPGWPLAPAIRRVCFCLAFLLLLLLLLPLMLAFLVSAGVG